MTNALRKKPVASKDESRKITENHGKITENHGKSRKITEKSRNKILDATGFFLRESIANDNTQTTSWVITVGIEQGIMIEFRLV